MSKPEIFTLSMAARHYKVTTETLRRWDRTGVLKARRMGNNHRYYLKKDLTPMKKDKKK